jgi:hypothetical protein
VKLLLKNRLPSGALQFTIFVSVVIALLLAAVMLLAYTHGFFIKQSKAIIENIQMADSGIAALKTEDITGDTIALTLKDDKGQEVKMHLSHWGIFEKAFVETTHRKKKFVKCCLMGCGLLRTKRPALYLAETYSPLAVVGNTEIRGMAFLPQQGIRQGNISGNSYYGSQLLYGEMQKSEMELPKLKYDHRKDLGHYLYDQQPIGKANTIPLISGSRLVNSFNDPVKVSLSAETVLLDNVSLSGNIILRSATKIVIRKNSSLKDIIVAAPVIEVEDGFKGSFQAIANTTIKIGKNCLLSYPTALILIEKEQAEVTAIPSEIDNKIFVGTGSEVRGSICYLKVMEKQPDHKVNIFADTRSVIMGEIYCEGNLELKGNAIGTVYTRQFLTNEAGSIFVNHLYNVKIESDKLPEAFGGILFENASKTVMKWLY